MEVAFRVVRRAARAARPLCRGRTSAQTEEPVRGGSLLRDLGLLIRGRRGFLAGAGRGWRLVGRWRLDAVGRRLERAAVLELRDVQLVEAGGDPLDVLI